MTTWFVSGASSGIGAELARQFAARGDHLALAARRLPRLEALAEELRPLGVTVTVHELDVVDAQAVDAAIRTADEVHADHGGLTGVVVNAGVGGGARIGVGSHGDNAHLLQVNVLGALAQMETALSLFVARNAGTVVLVSSVAGTRALPGTMAVYSASKAALRSLGRSVRADLAGTDVQVTTVLPGFVDSEMTQGMSARIKADVGDAVAQILDAIDRGADEAYVPGWWKPVAKGVLPLVPDTLMRRFG